MTTPYSTGPLSPDRVPQAYPVVREIAEDLTLESWTEYARRILADTPDPDWPRGMTIAELDGFIRGLFSYQVVPSLAHGRIFEIRDFAAVQTIRRATLADSLMSAATRSAHAFGCTTMHAHVPTRSEWVVSYFEKAGHEVELVCLCQPLLLPA